MTSACFAVCALSTTACGGDDGDGDGDGADHGGDAPRIEAKQLEEDLEVLRAQAGAPGMAAALVLDDRVVWSAGFGEVEVGSGRAVTRDTPFRLASVSKTFLGVAALRAQELELVDLDAAVEIGAPIGTVDHDFSASLRDLAGHRSGIVDSDYYECSYHLETGEMYLDDDLVTLCGPEPVTRLRPFVTGYLDPQGALYSNDNFGVFGDYDYSNVGAALAGLVLHDAFERERGESLEAFCEAEIFEPLGLEHTAWHRRDLPDPDAAARPHRRVSAGRETIPDYALATFPDGGLHASVDDLARFLAVIVGGRGTDGRATVLSAESVNEMLAFTAVDDGFVTGQGVFWEQFLDLTGHTGGDPGVSTAMGYDEAAGVGFVILINESTETSDALLLSVFDRLSQFAADLDP